MTELPPGWTETTLSEIAEIRLGRQRSPKNHQGENMVPYLRAANVTWDGLKLDDVKEMNFTPDEVETYALRRGDIVVAEASGSQSEVGKPAMWKENLPVCCIQNTLLRVRTHGADPAFVLHLLAHEARSGRLGDASRGVGIHHIGKARLAAWPVWLPPLPEQHRIVEAIEERFTRLDAAEALLRRALKMTNRLGQSAVAHAISGDWPSVTVGSVSVLQEYGSSAKASADGEVAMIRMGNIQDGLLDWNSLKYLPEAHPDAHRYRLAPGDLLFNRTNSPELVGKSAVYQGGPLDACFASYLIRLRFNAEALPEWVCHQLNGPGGRRWASHARTQQVGQANINGTKLSTFEFPLPPIDVQRRTVQALEDDLSTVRNLRSQLERSIAQVAHLRRSILERAFTGELATHNPEDESLEMKTASSDSPPSSRRKVSS